MRSKAGELRRTRITGRLGPQCDYCITEWYRALRLGNNATPIQSAIAYLICRIGNAPKITVQRLCLHHLKEERANLLPSARCVVARQLPNTPSKLVYSLSPLRDESQLFIDYFGSGAFPEWGEIRSLLEPASRIGA